MGGGKKDKDTGRTSVNGKYDQSGRKSRIPAAYPVTMLVDLQVYVVPREKWVLSRRLYRHNIVEEGISLGFVRVLPQLSIHNLRRELQLQLGPDLIPRDFIFVRGVGNIFIQLKPKQEIELKVKNFIPPFSAEPEIYLLEVLPNEDPRMISPLPLLLREDTPPHICHDLCHHSRARKTIQITKRDPESPQPTTPFPPVSITPSQTSCYSITPCTPYSFNSRAQQSSPNNSSVSNNYYHEYINSSQQQMNDDSYNPLELSLQLSTAVTTPTPATNSVVDTPELTPDSGMTQLYKSDSNPTMSASSPDTVIHVEPQDQSKADLNTSRVETDTQNEELSSRDSSTEILNSSEVAVNSQSESETVTSTNTESEGNDKADLETETEIPVESVSSPNSTEGSTVPLSVKSNSRGKKTESSLNKENAKKEIILKAKSFPNPRKPSTYPQRLNKVTLARQALAREKRRVYVEERIHSYLRGNQSGPPKPIIPLPMSKRQSLQDIKQPERHESILNTGFQKVPLIDEININKFPIEKVTSLPDITSQGYHINNPPSGISKAWSTISIARVTPRKSSSLNSTQIGSMHSFGMPYVSFGNTSPKSIFVESVPQSASNQWKGVSEQQGFFYSFRVRQSGPVQMLDKSVQTGEHPPVYNLNFSQSNGSYYVSTPQQQAYSIFETPALLDHRDKILREIAETVQLRHDAELRRAELVQRANDLQARVKEKRDKINRRHEFWHKKYIEESSLTRPIEAACNSLRAELNTVHRRLLAHLEGRDLPLRLRDGPSKKVSTIKANYKIMAARLQHEIKELQQKSKSAKLRLESEINLKEQADREVRDIRNDLAHKKVVMSLARSQVGSLPAVHPRAYDSLVY